MSAPAVSPEVADLVGALLRDPRRPGKRDLLAPASAPAPRTPPAPRLPVGRSGIGTSALRLRLSPRHAADQSPSTAAAGIAPGVPAHPVGARLPGTPTTDAAHPRDGAERPEGDGPREKRVEQVPALYCPPAVRDDPALGEEVDDRLVEWAEEVGVYPGQLDRVRAAGFGRLIMLAHPETDDPDRLLAAAKCALSEWSVDDHYVDGEVEEARPETLGRRLAIAHSVIDQAHLPRRYAPQLEEVVRGDPVMVALRSSLANLGAYATAAQVRRLRHELAIMFVAYNQEAVWLATGHRPPVWEFLMHRHENSFVPCMALIDPVAGYELPWAEFAQPSVRRVFTLAGSASVIVNDLYSMGKEDVTDLSLPRLIATEDDCSLGEAVQRTVDVHDELMHAFEAEAAALALSGSPELRRFLWGLWAWLGGSREWHARSPRYHGADSS
ncbi:family 2 encapsulin nanocompartment cargo protein terpene cyclase [Nocardiopsis quinghaiensis]|uniref:family 2 encapsulin nanocompartment cargo protein terpene cyclase n=1 Tax=Nocardiopsis quinghaiensis TaxID=464995 RepID=UPI00123AF679|nr:family 2 encapsulin nanocompartment cargo protein terpene cyclase [Nocardiopsis quinghaiensis]